MFLACTRLRVQEVYARALMPHKARADLNTRRCGSLSSALAPQQEWQNPEITGNHKYRQTQRCLSRRTTSLF